MNPNQDKNVKEKLDANNIVEVEFIDLLNIKRGTSEEKGKAKNNVFIDK